MSSTENEIDIELAQERLDTVLDGLYSATAAIVGLQAATIASVAEADAIRDVLIKAELCTEAELLNQTADNIVDRMDRMIDDGILDDQALDFQNAEEDDALEEV